MLKAARGAANAEIVKNREEALLSVCYTLSRSTTLV